MAGDILLDVPYFAQPFAGACGPTALQMVYRYLRPSKLSKFRGDKLIKKKGKQDPHKAGALRMMSMDLVRSAQDRGLNAGAGFVNPDLASFDRTLRYFLEGLKVPLIACQQYRDEEPELGHFRVIVGVESGFAILHDPCPTYGGKSLKWSFEELARRWRPSGKNVTGGVAIWVSKSPVEWVPLMLTDRDSPWPMDVAATVRTSGQ